MGPEQIRGRFRAPVRALGLGVFDGFHRAHQQLADRSDHLLTFSQHPALVLKKRSSVLRLSTLSELRYWVPSLLVLPFSMAVARLEAKAFLETVIMPIFSPKVLVVGSDYRFGYRQQGDVAFLRAWGSEHGVDIQAVPLYSYEGTLVKSTQIRGDLAAGDLDKVRELLGHDYLMIGRVVAGDGRGARLGFPTANLSLPKDKAVPAPGVYSSYVRLDGQIWPAMTYIGHQPTFEKKLTPIVEVHLMGFKGNLYRRQLKVFLNARIRGEQRFESESDLMAQIRQDMTQVVPA
ncbi:MAG: riboflavin biosynthesis protein RibF [Actinobacteria bacterium]|nr:riboflavin biosynthesis protein RibF [Actinomycetota bacterium]